MVWPVYHKEKSCLLTIDEEKLGKVLNFPGRLIIIQLSSMWVLAVNGSSQVFVYFQICAYE